MVKMTKKVQNYQIDQNGQNDQFGQKIEKKLEKKNKSIEARDDARASKKNSKKLNFSFTENDYGREFKLLMK